MILIDGSYILHRSLKSPGALDLKAADGTITGGVHYFMNTMQKLMKITHGNHGAVIAWDLGSSKYRRAIYPEYKAGRKSTEYLGPEASPEDHTYADTYVWSRSMLHKIILPLAEFVSIQVPEVEADDIIAWFANMHKKDDILIVSSDKDFYQLLDDRVKIYNPREDKIISKDDIIDSWKLIPSMYRDHLLLIRAMMGDVSDGIWGVDGIGYANAARISSTLLTEGIGGLDLTKKKNQAYMNGRDIVDRNLRLMDLRIVPDELRQDILDNVRSSLVEGDQNSTDELHDRLWDMELRKVKGFIDDLTQINLRSGIKSDVASALGVR